MCLSLCIYLLGVQVHMFMGICAYSILNTDPSRETCMEYVHFIIMCLCLCLLVFLYVFICICIFMCLCVIIYTNTIHINKYNIRHINIHINIHTKLKTKMLYTHEYEDINI